MRFVLQFQLPTEGRERPGRPRLHGADRNVELPRRLGFREVLEIAEHDHFDLIRRQSPQRLDDHISVADGHRRVFGGGLDATTGLHPTHDGPVTPPAGSPVEHGSTQVGEGFVDTAGGETGPGPGIGVGDDVLGLGGVAAEHVGEADQSDMVLADQRVEVRPFGHRYIVAIETAADVNGQRLRQGGTSAGILREAKGQGFSIHPYWTPDEVRTFRGLRAPGPPGGGVGYDRPVKLPVVPPVSPMLAKLSRELPEGPGLYYEPKWDGFRCIVFRDGDEVVLGSRNERPLTRYFPEVVEALRQNLPARCVLDGEIVVAGPNGLDFDLLSQRIHPAESRVTMLAETTPASFVAFDALATGEEDLRDRPYRDRRQVLERLLARAQAPVHLTPVTDDAATARDWFDRFEGAGLDGVVAKSAELRYEAGKRLMMKVKHERTAECVVAGFRWHKEGGVVGSLLLGIYDRDGVLHHVGVASGFSAARRRAFVDEIAPYRPNAADHHPWIPEHSPSGRVPGGPSRWNAGKDLSWEPLRPETVVEVSFDHLQGDRFRHATSFLRWRPERSPESCTYEQLDTPVPTELRDVFQSGAAPSSSRQRKGPGRGS